MLLTLLRVIKILRKTNFLIIFLLLILPVIYLHSLSNFGKTGMREEKNSYSFVQKSNTPPTINQLSQYRMNVTFFKDNATLNCYLNLSYLNSETTSLNYLFFNLWPNGIKSNSLSINNVTHNEMKFPYLSVLPTFLLIDRILGNWLGCENVNTL